MLDQFVISDHLIGLSQEILLSVKLNRPADQLLLKLTRLNNQNLNQLDNDTLKKTFWINIYNAFIQLLLKENEAKYEDKKTFFSKKSILIGTELLSLDNIEHGILRRSKIKWGLGLLTNPFPGKFEKANRVSVLDFRIHFALNCGAKSCPPIAFYKTEILEDQLNMATKSYLLATTNYSKEENTIFLPAIMNWFRYDFLKENSFTGLLKKYKIIPEQSNPIIKFSNYNWELLLGNFNNE